MNAYMVKVTEPERPGVYGRSFRFWAVLAHDFAQATKAVRNMVPADQVVAVEGPTLSEATAKALSLQPDHPRML